MAYKKQLFVDGDVLTASHLNTIEQGIVTNETAIENQAAELATAAAQAATATTDIASMKTNISTNTANINKKQDKLVSGTNIKTINGSSILGSGNLTIAGGSGAGISLYDQAKLMTSRYHHQYMKTIDKPVEKEVDLVLFAGQSNSCGRAQLADCSTPEDFMMQIPIEKAFHFNGTASTTEVQIVEPISANGTSTYGYIPAWLNAYYETTGRRVCAAFTSVGGANLNTFVPFKLDDNSQPTTTANATYTKMVTNTNYAKTQLEKLGYTIGGIYLVWCQGENDGYYYGTSNSYATKYEQSLTTTPAKRKYYADLFMTMIDGLKKDIGLEQTFIIRIGHRKGQPWDVYGPIVYAQNDLGRYQEDCVLVSTVFAGAEKFIEEDGSIRCIMRDVTHYKPEGYIRAGLEGGVNAGIYINSGKKVKPILLEYERMLFEDQDARKEERPVDTWLYNPNKIDFALMAQYAADAATSIGLTFTSTTIGVGDTAQIVATVYPTTVSDGSVTYTSSSNTVATVSDTGLITAKEPGTATITVTSNLTPTIKNTVSVTVVDAAIPVSSITLNQTTASMLVGETLQLTATVLPATATDKTVTWTSSDSGAAKVDQNGLVTALEQGTATITATPNGNSALKATCEITLAHNSSEDPEDPEVPSDTMLLDLDFTEKTLNDYISDGVLENDESLTTLAGITYDAEGMHTSDNGLLRGIKIVNAIPVNSNWTVETEMKLNTDYETAGSASALNFNHFCLIGTAATSETEGHVHGSNCHCPDILCTTADPATGGAAQIQLGDSGGLRCSTPGFFTFDNQFHTYKFVMDAATLTLTLYRDGTKIATQKHSNGLSGSFGRLFGVHNGYSSAKNFAVGTGHTFKTIKVY